MQADYLILAGLVVAIICLVVLAKLLLEKGAVSFSVARKILHVGAIGISAFSVILQDQLFVLQCIVGGSLPLLFVLVHRGFFKDPKSGDKSWGVVYFALSFLLLLLFFGDRPSFVFYPLLTLAVADGLAAIVGEFIGKHKYKALDDSKTWEGSLAFLFSCIICLGVIPSFMNGIEAPFYSLSSVLIAALALTLGEAVFEKGTDNLIIPAFVVYWMMLDLTYISGIHLWISLGVFGLGVIAVKLKALKLDGAMAAVLMGVVLMISPDPLWAAPPLTLFVVGTLLSKMPGKFEQSSNARNAVQVLANGGIPTLFLMCFFSTQNLGFLIGGMAGFAAALSDTASSEIGTRYQQKTYSILSFSNVPSGLSGGISLIGLFAGVIFSFLMAAVAVNISKHINLYLFALIGAAGFVGNLVDSVVGDIWQIKYKSTASSEWSDNSGSEVFETRGHNIVTNDFVNFIAVFVASCLGYLLFELL